ncbi:MAG: 2OG-Fe(II) oxygenase [Myxococcota bacterium]
MGFQEILGDRIFTVEGVLNEDECWALIEEAEMHGFEMPDVHTEDGVGVVHAFRNHMRAMFNSPTWTQVLMARLDDHLPAGLWGNDPTGLNTLLRIQHYRVDEHFSLHTDGAYHDQESGDVSQLTLLVYLNDGFEGGETCFTLEDGEQIWVEPESGQALLFEHDIEHEGCAVLSGEKYVLRTDVMYPT